jgi:hypothetical protein
MKASLIVAKPSATDARAIPRKRGVESNATESANLIRPPASGAAEVARSTKIRSTASPMTAKQKLQTNTTSKPPGTSIRTDIAASGPSRAPVASSARCTPNAAARMSPRLSMAIRASRGAVRMPFPIRSVTTTAASSGDALPAASSASREIAESAYPAAATSLWRRHQSAAMPPISRVDAAAPL